MFCRVLRNPPKHQARIILDYLRDHTDQKFQSRGMRS
jgi:hypothetical protein